MKELTVKTLLIALILSILFTIMLMDAIFVSYWFIIPALFPFVGFIIMVVKILRCPYCGRRENLGNLFYAINHEYYCRFCGCQFIIKKKINNEKV